jgi:hypothetical protein
MLVDLNEVDTNILDDIEYPEKCSILIEKEGLLLKKV